MAAGVGVVPLSQLALPTSDPDGFVAARGALKESLGRCGVVLLELGSAEAAALSALLDSGGASELSGGAPEAGGAAAGSAAGQALHGNKTAVCYTPGAASPGPGWPTAFAALSRAGRSALAAASPAADYLLDSSLRACSLSRYDYAPGAGGAAPHVDRGLFTLVFAPGGGLQVVLGGVTTPLPLSATRVACLAGELLQYVSQAAVPPCTHGVSPQAAGRRSLVLRLRPEAAVRLPRGPGLFSRWATAGEFEAAFVASHLSVNEPAAEAVGGKPAAALAPLQAKPAPTPAKPVPPQRAPLPPPPPPLVTRASAKRARAPDAAEDAIAPPVPVKAEKRLLSLQIMDSDGYVVDFRVSGTTRMGAVLKAYCAKMSLDIHAMRFIFDGDVIRDHNITVSQLELEDGDAIDCYPEQIGD